MRRAAWEASRCGQCHAPCLRCSPLSTCPLVSTRVQVQARGRGLARRTRLEQPRFLGRACGLSIMLRDSTAPGLASWRSAASPLFVPPAARGLWLDAMVFDIPCDGFSPPSRFPTAGKGPIGNAMGPLPFCVKLGWPLRWSDMLRCIFCADYLRKTECKASFRELPKAAPV